MDLQGSQMGFCPILPGIKHNSWEPLGLLEADTGFGTEYAQWSWY